MKKIEVKIFVDRQEVFSSGTRTLEDNAPGTIGDAVNKAIEEIYDWKADPDGIAQNHPLHKSPNE